MKTMLSPASATVVMRVRKVMMRVLTHGMVTNVATQSRPAMMRRVRDRFGRVEKGWMIVRYLKIFCRVQSFNLQFQFCCWRSSAYGLASYSFSNAFTERLTCLTRESRRSLRPLCPRTASMQADRPVRTPLPLDSRSRCKLQAGWSDCLFTA